MNNLEIFLDVCFIEQTSPHVEMLADGTSNGIRQIRGIVNRPDEFADSKDNFETIFSSYLIVDVLEDDDDPGQLIRLIAKANAMDKARQCASCRCGYCVRDSSMSET